MKIIITESQYNLLLETKSVSAAQTLIDMAVDDYIESCDRMKAFQNIQLALCKGLKRGTVKLEVTNVEKKENENFEDKTYFIIHLILYVDQEWMLENPYYTPFETTLELKIAHLLGTLEYFCYIDEIKMIDNVTDKITESKNYNTKNQKLIKQMWYDGYSVEEIQNYTGIDKNEFYFILKDEKQGIDCPESYQTIMDMVENTDLINKKINVKDIKLELDTDDFVGTLNFIYRDDDFHIEGMATPYYDGNCFIPIDIGYFEDLSTNEYNDEYDELQMTIDDELAPKKFNSYQEIIDFMNNQYPYLIIPKIQNSIPHYIDRLSN